MNGYEQRFDPRFDPRWNHHISSLESIQVPETNLFSNIELKTQDAESIPYDHLPSIPATPKRAVLVQRTLPLAHINRSTTGAKSDLPLPEKSLCYFTIDKGSRTLIWPLDSTIRETNLEEARKKMRMVPSFEHMLVNGFINECGHQEMTVSFSITPPILKQDVST